MFRSASCALFLNQRSAVNRSGFSFIEVLVALVVGSILSVSLYRMLYQTVKVTEKMTTMTDDYADVLLMKTEFERDIAGIVVIKRDVKTGNRAAVVPGAPPEQQKEQKSMMAQQQEESAASSQEKEEPQFRAEVRDGKLLSLALVTTHALPQVDLPGSHLVRVRYRLEDDPYEKGLMRLMREEYPYEQSGAKELEKLARPYPLLQRITSVKMVFYMRIVSKEGKPGETRMRSVTEWGGKEGEDSVPVPEYIRLEGTCRSHNGHDEVPFSLVIAVPIAASLYEKKQYELMKKNSAAPKSKAPVSPVDAAATQQQQKPAVEAPKGKV